MYETVAQVRLRSTELIHSVLRPLGLLLGTVIVARPRQVLLRSANYPRFPTSA